MKITIIEIDNGWTVTTDEHPADGQPHTVAFAYDRDDDGNPTEIKAGVDLLWELIDLLGIRGGRYDKERAMAGIEKGDKYEGGSDG